MGAGPQHSAAAVSQQIFLGDELCNKNQGLKDTDDQILPVGAGGKPGLGGDSYLLFRETCIQVTWGFPEAAPSERDVDPRKQLGAWCCPSAAPRQVRARQAHSSTLQFKVLANVVCTEVPVELCI